MMAARMIAPLSPRTLMLLLALAIASGKVLSAPSEPLVIVAHSSVTEQQLSQRQLLELFTMRNRFWSPELPVTVFVLDKEDPNHQAFCQQKLNLFCYRLERVWSRLVFSGYGRAPVRVKSMEEMRNRVAETPGAIGYLNVEQVNEQVKVLVID